MPTSQKGDRAREVNRGAALGGHPQPWTIGTRLAEGWWSGKNLAAYWARVGESTVEGRSLRDEPFRTRTPFAADYRLAKKFGEVLAVARALAFLDESADLVPSERPDIIASPARDGIVGVEVVEITDTAPHSAILDQMRLELSLRLEARGIVPRMCFSFSFDFKRAARNGVGTAHPASDPTRFFPRGRDRTRVIDEMADIVASGRSARWEPIDGSVYPTLARYGVCYAGWENGFRYARIGEGTVAYRPSSLIPTAASILTEKRNEARHYRFSGPLWLVMDITDRRGEFYETAIEFAHSRPEIAPFNRVHILHRELMMFSDVAFGGWAQVVVNADARRRLTSVGRVP